MNGSGHNLWKQVLNLILPSILGLIHTRILCLSMGTIEQMVQLFIVR